jgi:hypothetical protein
MRYAHSLLPGLGQAKSSQRMRILYFFSSSFLCGLRDIVFYNYIKKISSDYLKSELDLEVKIRLLKVNGHSRENNIG